MLQFLYHVTCTTLFNNLCRAISAKLPIYSSITLGRNASQDGDVRLASGISIGAAEELAVVVEQRVRNLCSVCWSANGLCDLNGIDGIYGCWSRRDLHR